MGLAFVIMSSDAQILRPNRLMSLTIPGGILAFSSICLCASIYQRFRQHWHGHLGPRWRAWFHQRLGNCTGGPAAKPAHSTCQRQDASRGRSAASIFIGSWKPYVRG